VSMCTRSSLSSQRMLGKTGGICKRDLSASAQCQPGVERGFLVWEG
jgi:hypothetical protein